MDIPGWLREVGNRLARGDIAGARQACAELLRVAPQLAEVHYLLGETALADAQPRVALAAFERAISLKPALGPPHAMRARALDALGRGEEAVAAAETAAGLVNDPRSFDTIGVVLTRAGLHARATEMYSRAVKGAKFAGYWYNYGASLQFLGEFDRAREAYRQALWLDQNHALAWAGLVQITKQTGTQNDVAALMRVAEAVKADRALLLRVGHALAKAHDDLGDPAGAMAWLATAKAGWRREYDAAADMARFQAAERSIGPVTGGDGAGPIFVVGMPRTGTTLIERILSSHSAVETVGETNLFALALRRATGLGGDGWIDAELIAAGTDVDLAAMERDYVRSVSATRGVAGRFVEKQPFNAFLVPAILRALPGARVAMLRRHPADVVLSSYRQDFADAGGMLGYTWDLEATARYVVRFDAMAKAFAAALPKERYCEVRYEDVVSDLPGQVTRLLDFCGLPFEEACVRFQDNASPVATASAAQVRELIYDTSVGRWKRYRPAIDSALKVLVEAGLMESGEAGL
jgi:tetratricopeptide (TPR) repeat protein